MPTAMAAPHSSKADLRASLLAERAACDPALGLQLAERVLAACSLEPGRIVAGYWPLKGEIDVRPLLLAWAASGHIPALPQAMGRGQPLVFHRWRPGAPLQPGPFRTLHPDPAPVVPHVILVPMVGFDRGGNRLGYGAGYYDRTLAELPRARAIGCAFAIQEVCALPAEAHDRPMDAIATEQEFFTVSPAA